MATSSVFHSKWYIVTDSSISWSWFVFILFIVLSALHCYISTRLDEIPKFSTCALSLSPSVFLAITFHDCSLSILLSQWVLRLKKLLSVCMSAIRLRLMSKLCSITVPNMVRYNPAILAHVHGLDDTFAISVSFSTSIQNVCKILLTSPAIALVKLSSMWSITKIFGKMLIS